MSADNSSTRPQAPWSTMTRIMVRVHRSSSRGMISILGGLALWELLSRYVIANALFLASPLQIAAAIVKLSKTGELLYDIGISGVEFILGYVIASVIGIAIGVAMASSTTIKQMGQPWVSGLYATPVIALAPLFILWLGIGIWSKVFVVGSLVVFPVIINTEAGLLTTSSPTYRDAPKL